MNWQVDAAAAVLQIVLGLFFAVAGWRKCFVPTTVKRIRGLFNDLHLTKFQLYAVTYGQLLGGAALLSGVWVRAAAILLLPIMVGAVYLSAYPETKQKTANEHWTSFMTSFICTAEVQMIAGLVVLALIGPSDWLQLFPSIDDLRAVPWASRMINT